MTRHFDLASTEYLIHSNAVITATPLTMACWVNLDQLPSNTGDEFTAIGLGDTSAAHFFYMRGDDATDAVQFNARAGGGTEVAQSTTDVVAGAWEHWCAVSRSAIDRSVFLNGGSEGTNTVSRIPSGIDNATIGAVATNSVVVDYMDGVIAEVALWNIDLLDAEVLMLSRRVSPLFVRPQNLVAYWPLIRTLKDRVGKFDMTVGSGTSIVAHAPIIYPAPIHVGLAPFVAAVVTVPDDTLAPTMQLVNSGGMIGAVNV